MSLTLDSTTSRIVNLEICKYGKTRTFNPRSWKSNRPFLQCYTGKLKSHSSSTTCVDANHCGREKLLLHDSNFLATMPANNHSSVRGKTLALTQDSTCVSWLHPLLIMGRMGRSIRREINTSGSLGRPSRLMNPPL